MIALSGLIACYGWSVKNFGEGLDQGIAIVGLAVVFIAVPVFKLVFLLRNDLTSQSVRDKWLCLYEKLRFKRTRWALAEPFVSDVRRLVLALTIICLQGYPTFQLMSVYFQILAVTIFNGLVEPFKERAT